MKDDGSNNKGKPSIRRRRPPIGWLIGMLVGVAGVWALSGWAINSLYGKPDGAGTFGDMFGAVNSLFSGAAFATLIYTIWMQHYELALQRRELKMTRKELRGQKKAMEEQSNTFTQQRLEATFFELLKVHGQIIEALDVPGNIASTRAGRATFAQYYRNLCERYAGVNRSWSPDSGRLVVLTAEYKKFLYDFFIEIHSETGHYYRHLYQLLRFIAESELKDQMRYAEFVRAQLSAHELVLLFYLGLSDHGFEAFKPLIERYHLMQSLPPSLLLRPSDREQYSDAAFAVDTKVSA